MNPKEKPYRTYLFNYPYEGKRWAFEIKAASPEEAQERITFFTYARYDGELKMRLPLGLGWLGKLLCWLHNRWAID